MRNGLYKSIQLAACVLGLFCAVRSEAEERVRTWKDRKGNSVEGALLKEEGGVVFIKRADGQTVQAKMENLCDADRSYVWDVTYVPRDVVVVLKKHAYKDLFESEVGESEKVTMRDSVVLRTVEDVQGAAPQPANDTRWKIGSLDNLGSRLLPRNLSETNEYVTEGSFLFLTYTVKNDTPEPVAIAHPVLIDTQGRKYLQAVHPGVVAFMPDGAAFAGRDRILPGETKLFCSFYDVAHDTEPAAVEVFPSKASPHFIRRFESKGKEIQLSDAGDASSAEGQAEGDNKAAVFLKCVRLGQGGDISQVWTYDRTRGRSLVYGLEMRVSGQQQKKAAVKTYFIAAADNLDLVVGRKEEPVILDPDKICRLVVQSETVEEGNIYVHDEKPVMGVKPKGIVAQVWIGDTLVASFCSMNQWKKIAESADVVKQMGELKLPAP